MSMKKVLYFLVALAFISCDKSEITNDGKILESNEPYYYNWDNAEVHARTKGDICRAYFNSDSVIVEFKDWNDLAGKYYVDVHKHSTHNNVFADVDPSRMTDEQFVEFARDFTKELKRETDRKEWVETLDWVFLCDSPTVYGLLWGLQPKSFSTSTPGVFGKSYTVDFFYDPNKNLSYYIKYENDISYNTEKVIVKKFETDENRHTEDYVLAEFDL